MELSRSVSYMVLKIKQQLKKLIWNHFQILKRLLWLINVSQFQDQWISWDKSIKKRKKKTKKEKLKPD